MKTPLLVCALFCLTSVPLVSAHSAADRALDQTSFCESMLAPMAEVLATVRAHQALSEVQETQWRHWNKLCTPAAWQMRLAALGPPVPPQPAPVADLPRPLGWRDYVIGALQGFQRGLDTPQTVCRTTYSQRGSHGGYSTICSTY